MKQEIADKWITALLSGEFEQGRHLLHNDNKFCCLGVLCKLYADATGIQGVKSPDFDFVHYHNQTERLPIEVMKWSGMASAVGVLGEDHLKSLAGMNDTGSTFVQLAEVIKQHTKEL